MNSWVHRHRRTAAGLGIILAIVSILLLRVHHAWDRPAVAAMPPARTAAATASRGESAAVPSKGIACPLAVGNGTALLWHWGVLRNAPGHVLTIENRSGLDTIVKLRDVMLGATRAAIFVSRRSVAHYDHVPVGGYIVDYALGQTLDAPCTGFLHVARTMQYGILTFEPGHQTVVIPDLPGRDAGLEISPDVFAYD